MRARIWLLRIMLGWWAIPFSWVIVWPVLALIAGVREATESVLQFNHDLWFGIS